MQEIIQINNTDVVFEMHEGKIFADSLSVSKTFNKDHKNILRSIRDLPSGNFRRLNFEPSFYLNAQNKEQPMYRMTRDGFSMLIWKLTGKEAFKWQVQFLEAFNLMEQKLTAGTSMTPALIAFNSQATKQIDALHTRIGTLAKEIGSVKDQFVHDAKERADIHIMLHQNTIATDRLNFALENMAMDTHQLGHIRKVVDSRGKELSSSMGVSLDTAIPTVYRSLNRKFNVRTYLELKREDYEAILDYIPTVTL